MRGNRLRRAGCGDTVDLIPTIVTYTCIHDGRVGSCELRYGYILRGEEERKFSRIEESGCAGGAGVTIDATALAAVLLDESVFDHGSAGMFGACKGCMTYVLAFPP